MKFELNHKREFDSATAREGGAEMLQGAVKMTIRLCRKLKRTSRRFGDFDNLAKAICDSLNGVCYVDDAQVVSYTIEKIQAEKPRIELEIDSC